ncbi:hypothetical protein D3C80_1621970 [compost metagenome]
MAQGHEEQRTAAPHLFLGIEQRGHTGRLAIDPQRLEELDTSACPHAVAAGIARQDRQLGRMTIAPQARFVDRRLKECPLPKWWQRIARGRRLHTQGGGDALDQAAVQALVGVFAAADPVGIR